MDLQVGSIVSGKVTGIAKFGAFVEVAPGKSGLVHISEIADKYVSEVSEHLTVGQEVRVKLLAIDGDKLNLSIKAANPPEDRPRTPRTSQPRDQVYTPKPQEPEGELTFEDRLKRFMKDSNSKISDMRRSSDRQNGARRRGK